MMDNMTELNITCWIGDELAVDVYYDYDPGEPEVLYPIDKAHPGCGAEIIVNMVMVNGSDILNCLNQKTINKIEDNINEFITNKF